MSLAGQVVKMSSCIFCKIANGEDKETKILYQDEDIIIIPDKFPAAKHHILVIPKNHIENATHLTSEHLSLSKHPYY